MGGEQGTKSITLHRFLVLLLPPGWGHVYATVEGHGSSSNYTYLPMPPNPIRVHLLSKTLHSNVGSVFLP